ncbi:MAG: hypothetical protein KGZ49_09325 [Syntrophaceae bacterium]|nr:hypothetical protein [Syntrophaceae bacterium]
MELGKAKRLNWRKIGAFLFLVLLALTLAWAFKKDFASKDFERILSLPLISDNNYILNLNSFDIDTEEVKGVLSFKKGLPIWDDNPIFYGPLSYYDLTYTYAAWREFVNINIGFLREVPPPVTSFTKSLPSPVEFSIKALGNSQIYPFDKYFIMGAVTCQVYIKKGKQKEYVHTKENVESIKINNYIKGFFIRSPTKIELDEIKNIFKVFTKEKAPPTGDAEIREMNNEKNRFGLIMERPYYLKIMTVVLGTIALLSALTIGFKTRFKDLPVQLIGYVIGVWGIRSILLGDLKIFPSYFDYTILGMYVLLFAGIIFRRIKGETGKKKSV